MNDILGDDIRRCRLCAEDADQRYGRQMPRLDFIILMDKVEQVQLLTLILMQTFGLNIKHCLCVY